MWLINLQERWSKKSLHLLCRPEFQFIVRYFAHAVLLWIVQFWVLLNNFKKHFYFILICCFCCAWGFLLFLLCIFFCFSLSILFSPGGGWGVAPRWHTFGLSDVSIKGCGGHDYATRIRFQFTFFPSRAWIYFFYFNKPFLDFNLLLIFIVSCLWVQPPEEM